MIASASSTNDEDLLLAGDSHAGIDSDNLSYWRLVWRRFRKNPMGVLGGIGVLLILLMTVFADFLSPYDPLARGGDNIYNPPQSLNFFYPDTGFSVRPFVHPTITDFDDQTFEVLQRPDLETVCPLYFFAKGWQYSFVGIDMQRHLFSVREGCNVNLAGTDNLGRDILSRMLRGSQPTLLMAAVVVTIIVIIGSFLGIMSGYRGGWFDMIVQRIAEFALALPDLPLYLALAAVLPRTTDPYTNFAFVALILSVLRWAQLAREVRSKTLSIKAIDYIQAAEALGASRTRIAMVHILPNVITHVIIITSLMIPTVILIESFLSFLGLGVKPPLVSWGLMLNAARDFQVIGSYPWVLSPVFLILLAVLAFNALGDGLRDAMDPYANVN